MFYFCDRSMVNLPFLYRGSDYINILCSRFKDVADLGADPGQGASRNTGRGIHGLHEFPPN